MLCKILPIKLGKLKIKIHSCFELCTGFGDPGPITCQRLAQVMARIKRMMAQNERSVDDVLLHNPRTQRALELFGPLVLNPKP